MVGEDHRRMNVTVVTATEVVVVDFQSILTTGVCLHDSYYFVIIFCLFVLLKIDVLRFHLQSW